MEPAQIEELYKALASALQAGYAKSGISVATEYQGWKRYNTRVYQSETHGNRFVSNYANETASAYGEYDPEKVLPEGSVLAKDSVVPTAEGKLEPGPLFLMEKMSAGFNEPSADWKYALVMPDGTIFGQTKGEGSENVAFCAECHQAAGTGQTFFMPEDLRVGN